MCVESGNCGPPRASIYVASKIPLEVNATSSSATTQHLQTREVLGVPVSVLGMEATVARMAALIEAGGTHVVSTVDSFGLVLAQEDEELMAVYRNADIATADSSGVVWALGRKGKAVERVSGVDLVDRLCGLSAEHGYRVFLLGSEPGVAELAAERLKLMHPGCNIVGTRHGFFPEDDDDVVAQEIAPHRPDILLVAMGIPRQEKFIAKTHQAIGAKISMGVGGSLDVYSGRANRAPRFVQRLTLEWMWRLMQNPRKFHKVARLPRFMWLVLRGGR